MEKQMVDWFVNNKNMIYDIIKFAFGGIGVYLIGLVINNKVNQKKISHNFNNSKTNKENIPLQYPPKVNKFTGREDDLTKLITDLQPGSIITLCGPGGIGKSALASEAIWTLAPNNQPCDRFPDGIIWHDFYKEPRMQNALENISLSYNEEPRPTPVAAVKRVLSKKKAFILLDGTEETDDLPLILDLLGTCCVLVTTRKKDANYHSLEMNSLKIDDAIKLFQEWCKTEDTVTVKKICELTGGLPLAVSLAGKYICETGESVEEYLNYLETTTLEALDHGKRKHKSVPILLDRSFHQVSNNAKDILGLAGVISFSSFSKDLVQAGLPDLSIKKSLNELLGYGLINRIDNRFIISHALIHKYARERHKPENSVIEKLVKYYRTYSKECIKQGPKGYALLDIERSHIMRLIEECKHRELWLWINEIILVVEEYLSMCGYWADRINALELSVNATQYLKDKNSEGVHVSHLGLAYSDIGEIEKAIKYYEKGLAISRNIKNRKGESSDLGNLGVAYNVLGQTEKAKSYYEQALNISREIKHRKGECDQLGNLGLVYSDLGQISRAIDYYEQALLISREIKHRKVEGNLLDSLGTIYCDLGQSKKALDYYEKALKISKEIGHRQGECNRLGHIGSSYRDLGQTEKAKSYYEQALNISREIKYRQGEANQLSNIGLVYRFLGLTDKSICYINQSLLISKEIGDRQGEASDLNYLGNAYRDLGQIEKAIDCYKQALKINEKIGNRQAIGSVLGNLGNVYEGLGFIEEAIEYYEKALDISRKIEHRLGESKRLGNLGIAYCSLDQIEKAIEKFKQALSISEEIGYQQGIAEDLVNLGLAYIFSRKQDPYQAIYYFAQSLKIYRSIGNKQGEAINIGNIGKAYVILKKIDEAIEYFEQALTINREI